MGTSASIPELAILLGRLLAFRRVSLEQVPTSPWPTLFLWLVMALVGLAHFFLSLGEGWSGYGSVLAGTTAPLLGALIVAALWRREALVPTATVLLLLAVANAAASLALTLVFPDSRQGGLLTILPMVWSILAGARFLSGNVHDLPELRRLPILLCAVVAVLGGAAVGALDSIVTSLGIRYVWQDEFADEGAFDFDAERFWTSQPAEIDRTLDRLRSSGGSPRTYVLAIAPDGTQALFEREAVEAGKVLQRRFDPGAPLVVMSNAASAVGRFPAAIQANFAALATGMKSFVDPQRDLIVIYLTSHGSRDAELSSMPPDYTAIAPVSARSIRRFLDDVGISRRVVIVSACYSGSWIAPLRSADTIVLTAAAADRTSFGCSDGREYTVFGKAVIESPLAEGASLAEAFEVVKREVAREEGVEEVAPSYPQEFIGANMSELWSQAREPTGKNARSEAQR
ncbi:C13 family peptidase [Erythrobacter mangrovi]|uniref:Peptidase C13 family protein n=1 Tax=Erythrobacter mangrovi TaxID=2739433 RepID=A0A7D4CN59_9SPHN|nr:C13 family peptidase [Erythrobacter mangrovi]QKG71808.1 hypothetical protein HQR01_10805 [Erythrobacter mangrovi]